MAENILVTDVLVIGGGGAGFRSAIGAREKGATTILLSKGPLARCGATPMAGADFTLDGSSLNKTGYKGDTNDGYEKVFNDIVTQGFYLNNQKLVDQYIRMAPQRLKELLDWGIQIKYSDERAVVTTGIGIMDALVKRAKSIGVEMLEDVMVIDLITQKDRVIGALALDIKEGNFIQFKAKAVIIATGGWHKAFWPNTGMRDLSGDGIAIALRAGAEIGNMEFITFCCNVFYEPPMWRGSLAPYILGLLAGHRLTNSEGETFLDKYDPYLKKVGSCMEWNKSFISHASTKEIREGKGGPNGGIYFSRGDVSWDKIQSVCNLMFPNWKYKALNLSEWGKKLESNQSVEVGPAVEYFEGGIVINERFETAIEGLFAAGECTLGVFGANRVFSAITEMLVQGADAGYNAAEYATTVPITDPDQESFKAIKESVTAPLFREEGLGPAPVRRRVQERAHKELGPIRNQAELSSFINFLDKVYRDDFPNLAICSKSRVYNKEWLDTIEIKNMVCLLKAAAKSALFRTESRGVHYREDYPETNNNKWLVETIIKDVNFDIDKRPVIVSDMTPPIGAWPFLDMMKMMMQAHSDTGGQH